jgi:DNA-binding NarL/FixJ family response regulator
VNRGVSPLLERDTQSGEYLMARITVLLADDHTIVRKGLRALVESEEDIEVVGEAETGRDAVSLAHELLPNVVVMDLAMPLLNGMEATRQITRELPSTRVLVLSSHADEEYVQRLTEAGAIGYLVKQSVAEELLTAIREASKGKAFFSPVISKRLLDRSRQSFLNGQTAKGTADRLTPRETEVLQMIAEGNANKTIAAALCISIKTVEKHRQQLMSKLDIHDVASLTRYALFKGIISKTTEGPVS